MTVSPTPTEIYSMTAEEMAVYRAKWEKDHPPSGNAFDYQSAVSGFSDPEKLAHGTLRSLLWMLYPREDSLEINPEKDQLSDHFAAMLVEGLKKSGLTIGRIND